MIVDALAIDFEGAIRMRIGDRCGDAIRIVAKSKPRGDSPLLFRTGAHRVIPTEHIVMRAV
jgi:hypothetical protein